MDVMYRDRELREPLRPVVLRVLVLLPEPAVLLPVRVRRGLPQIALITNRATEEERNSVPW